MAKSLVSCFLTHGVVCALPSNSQQIILTIIDGAAL